MSELKLVPESRRTSCMGWPMQCWRAFSVCGCAMRVWVGVDNGGNLAGGSVHLTPRPRSGPVSWALQHPPYL